MAKFDLFTQLAQADGPVSKSDTQVVEIRLDAIDDNEGNFYHVGNVDDLAESIQLVGLQQPLVVRRAGERFTLIAGHRRRKALQQLGRETAPCIITEEAGTADDAFAALRLIMTNSTARELTYPERMQQVKQVEAELVKLAEQGVKLPGKMRDRVAEITKESASEVARMNAIDKHLSKAWKGKLKKRQISASVAYEISKLDDAAQIKLKDAFDGHYYDLDAKRVKAAAVNYQYDWVPATCPQSPSYRIDMCTKVKDRAAYKDKHPDCSGCCSKCKRAKDCPMCCGVLSQKIAKKAEAEQRKQQAEEADAAFEKTTFAKMQRRFIEVLKDFGITNLTELEKATGLSYWMLVGILRCSREDAKVPLYAYCQIADTLGISLAQLLGLDVMPAAAEPEPIKWRGIGWDDPPHDMDIIAMFRTGDNLQHLRQARFEGGEYWMPLDNDPGGDRIPLANVFTHWAPLPGDEDA